MLKLVFAEAGPGPTQEAGPFQAVVLNGEEMCAADGEERVIAVHRDHNWFVGAKKYFRVDFGCAVRVDFEDDSGARETAGPFTHFSSADGIAYGDGLDFAHVDPDTGLWFSHLHRRYWKRLVVRPI